MNMNPVEYERKAVHILHISSIYCVTFTRTIKRYYRRKGPFNGNIFTKTPTLSFQLYLPEPFGLKYSQQIFFKDKRLFSKIQAQYLEYNLILNTL